MPRVSVVVPHYNDLAGLDRCLTALAAQTHDDYEVVVADNGSALPSGELEQVVGGRAHLVVIREKGAGPARNGGVAASHGDILAFIDSDCVAERDWLAAGERALGSYDFVGGRVKVLVGDQSRMSAAEAFEAVFAFDFESYITRKGFTGSGNMFVPRAVFDRVGGFRKSVSEDVEWSQRARALGCRLGYAPDAVVAHPARRTWLDLLQKWQRTNREMYLLAREQPRGRLSWALRMAAMPASAVLHSGKVLGHRDLPDARARALALLTLHRLRWWRMADGLRLLVRDGR